MSPAASPASFFMPPIFQATRCSHVFPLGCEGHPRPTTRPTRILERTFSRFFFMDATVSLWILEPIMTTREFSSFMDVPLEHLQTSVTYTNVLRCLRFSYLDKWKILGNDKRWSAPGNTVPTSSYEFHPCDCCRFYQLRLCYSNHSF